VLVAHATTATSFSLILHINTHLITGLEIILHCQCIRAIS